VQRQGLLKGGELKRKFPSKQREKGGTVSSISLGGRLRLIGWRGWRNREEEKVVVGRWRRDASLAGINFEVGRRGGSFEKKNLKEAKAKARSLLLEERQGNGTVPQCLGKGAVDFLREETEHQSKKNHGKDVRPDQTLRKDGKK